MPISLLTLLMFGNIFLGVVLLILLIAFISKSNKKNSNPEKFRKELSRIKDQIESS